jgi:hypothetical protein
VETSDIHSGQRKVGEEPQGQCPTEQEVRDVTAAHPESGAQLEQVRAAPIQEQDAHEADYQKPAEIGPD